VQQSILETFRGTMGVRDKDRSPAREKNVDGESEKNFCDGRGIDLNRRGKTLTLYGANRPLRCFWVSA
jgi:hypothetical protein